MAESVVLTIHTDGASRGNPGEAAFAYVIAREGQPPIEEADCLGSMTNNQAEYTALVRALEHALELGRQHRLLIHSDSELMVKQMNGEYRVKNEELRGLYEQACSLRDRFEGLVTIRHVRRAQNKRADELCNEALDGKRCAMPRAAPKAVETISRPPKPSLREEVLMCLRQSGGDSDSSPESIWRRLTAILERHGLTVPASERLTALAVNDTSQGREPRMSRYAFVLVLPLVTFLHTPEVARAAAADDRLQAGFAETDITPPLKDKTVYMAGFGHNRKAAGIHDPLNGGAIVLQHGKDKIALVAVDLVGFFHPHVERVRQRLPGFAYVLVSSTHNHEGPDTLGLWGATPFQSGVDADYLQQVEKQIIEAVKAADAARKGVTVRIGSTRAPELLHDAREPYVKHDELIALDFRDKENKPAGVVVQWNCHPETLGDKNTQISADFVGAVVKTLHAKHRCPVVYLTGTVGGLMTSLRVEVKNAAGKTLDDGTFAKTERYGELLAEVAERALKTAHPVKLTPLRVRQRTLFLPLDNKLFLLARQLGVLKREAFLWTGDPYKAEAARDVKAGKPLCLRTEIAWLRLGVLDIAAIPGEIYPELVLGKVQTPADPAADFPDAPAEPAIYEQLRGPHRMLIGLAADEIGYIIPKRQWDENPPFCYGRKKAQYGEVNSLGASTAPLLCEAFKELTRAEK